VVLNASSGGILYATQDMDITEMVIQRMDAEQGTTTNIPSSTTKPTDNPKPTPTEPSGGKK
ncbi:MAG: hypothetical protein JXR56_02990, partial [Candidatus Cloacimonetes bacterium]|nr:hypothetical protein [Candidatus Cloacimonadota bacterium]